MNQALSFPLPFLLVLLLGAHAQTATGARSIQQKLDTIRLPEIAYEGLPLDEVVADLMAESKRRDPPTPIKVNAETVVANPDALSRQTPPNQHPQLSQRLRAYVVAVGIHSMSDHEWSSRILFVPENGVILVNAHEDDLPRIKRVIRKLNSP